MYLSPIAKCICLILQNVFVSYCKMHLSQISKCACLILQFVKCICQPGFVKRCPEVISKRSFELFDNRSHVQIAFEAFAKFYLAFNMKRRVNADKGKANLSKTFTF